MPIIFRVLPPKSFIILLTAVELTILMILLFLAKPLYPFRDVAVILIVGLGLSFANYYWLRSSHIAVYPDKLEIYAFPFRRALTKMDIANVSLIDWGKERSLRPSWRFYGTGAGWGNL